MNIPARIIATIGGAHTPTLAECPEEVGRYVSMGLTILLTGTFAACSGAYAVLQVFDPVAIGAEHSPRAIRLAIALGIVWGIFIINLDRLIVMTMVKTDKSWTYYGKAVVRIAFAIIISLVIAKPLEVRLFQDRITAQIDELSLAKSQTDRVKIGEINGVGEKNQAVASAEAALANKVAEELRGDCRTIDCNTAAEVIATANRKLSTFNAAKQPKINAITNQISNFEGQASSYSYTVTDGVERRTLRSEIANKITALRSTRSPLIVERNAIQGELSKGNNALAVAKREYREQLAKELDAAKNEFAFADSLAKNAAKLANARAEQSDTANQIAYTNNLTTQLEALGSLTAWKPATIRADGTIIDADNTFFYINWMITILFIMIETSPVFVKMMTAPGAYDRLMEVAQLEREFEVSRRTHVAAVAAELRSQLAEQKLSEDLHAELTMAQREADERIRQYESELQRLHQSRQGLNGTTVPETRESTLSSPHL